MNDKKKATEPEPWDQAAEEERLEDEMDRQEDARERWECDE